MLRRTLSVVAGAAAVLLVPSPAGATADPAPVVNYTGGWGLTASAEEIPLADGRTASVSLWKQYREAGLPPIGYLSVQVWTDYPCMEHVWPDPDSDAPPELVPGTCQGGWTYGDLELTGNQIDVDRNLRTASVDAVVQMPVVDWTPPSEDGGGDGEWTDPGEGEWTDPGEEFPPFEEPETEPVAIQVVFTGSGTMDTQSEHGTVCGDGERECQSVRIYAARDGSVTGTIGGVAAPQAPARFSAVKGLDLAAPKFLYPL